MRSIYQDTSLYQYRWIIVVLTWIGYTVAFMSRISVSPLAPFIIEELHFSRADIGLFIAATYLAYLVFGIPGGILVDRFGVRLSNTVGLAVLAVFTILFTWISMFVEGFVIRFIGGLGGGLLFIATTRAIIIWFPRKERATMMGFKQSGVPLGGILSGLILPTLAIMYSWRVGFIVMGIFGIVISVLYLLFLREPQTKTAKPSVAIRDSIRSILKNRDILLLAIGAIPLAWTEIAGLSFMVLFLTEAHHIPVVTAGFLLALMQVAGAFARIGLGFVSDRLFDGKRKSVFLSCCILTGFLSLIIASMPRGISMWILAIIIFLWGFVALGWAALHLTMMGEFAGAESAGLATGVINLFTTPGIIFGPPLFGYIVDVTGSYALAWSLSGTICFASTLIIGLTREERKRI